MQLSGETKLLGLLGQDAFYTLSPTIHNRAIQIFGLDQVYVNFDLDTQSVSPFLDIFWKLGGIGLNVTKPHKNTVASLLAGNSLTSVNTLARGPNGWVGHSTDGAGFAAGLARMDVSVDTIENLVIMGSGGAAQSIIDYVLKHTAHKLQNLTMLRRSPDRDKKIQEIVGKNKFVLQFADWTPEALTIALSESAQKRTLLVQAAAVANPLEPALKEFTRALIGYQGSVVDLIYDKPSALYFAALHDGIKAQDGLPMLIEQARLSQKLWWGKSAVYEDLALAIKNTGRFS